MTGPKMFMTKEEPNAKSKGLWYPFCHSDLSLIIHRHSSFVIVDVEVGSVFHPRPPVVRSNARILRCGPPF